MGTQAVPEVHDTQTPALHTRLVPHIVPFAAFVPVSVHTAVPVEQLVVPVWHRLTGVHEAPVAHATQLPVRHTIPAPHAVPFARLAPVSVHTGLPVEQLVEPEWQGFVGTHAAYDRIDVEV